MLSKQYDIGTIFDIPFRISRLWVVMFVIATYGFSRPILIDRYVTTITPLSPFVIDVPLFNAGIWYVIFAGAVVLSVYGSVLLHELGHMYAARRNNIPIEGITLWVLGGVAVIDGQPTTARPEFEITIAGPLVSLILGITSLGLAYAVAPLGSHVLVAYFLLLTLTNIAVLMLNLLPAFPLDGGRLLRAGLTALVGYKRGTMYATQVGKVMAIGVFIVSIFTLQPVGVLLAGFVMFASRAENKRVADMVLDDSTNTFADGRMTVTDKTFVLETDIGRFNLAEITDIIGTHGGTVDMHVTPATDYIIIPEGEVEMYQTIAENYDTKIITDQTFTDQLEEVITDAKPSREVLHTSD